MAKAVLFIFMGCLLGLVAGITVMSFVIMSPSLSEQKSLGDLSNLVVAIGTIFTLGYTLWQHQTMIEAGELKAKPRLRLVNAPLQLLTTSMSQNSLTTATSNQSLIQARIEFQFQNTGENSAVDLRLRAYASPVNAPRRSMSSAVENRLATALRFSKAGFQESGAIVSWLARQKDDLLVLLEHGFEIQLLSRFVSDREKTFADKSSRSVLYQLALLHVKYENTDRFVVLRMTHQGVDDLLADARMEGRHLSEDGHVHVFGYRYLDLHVWMDLDCPSWLPDQQRVFLSLSEQRDSILEWLTSYIARIVEEASLRRMSGDKFEQLVEGMVTATYALQKRLDGQLFGVTNSEQEVLVSIFTIRAGRESVELPVDTLIAHTIVCAEHVQGLVEILYEGPQQLVAADVWTKREKTNQLIKTWAHQLRDLNSRVPHDLRLRTRKYQRSKGRGKKGGKIQY